MPTNADTVAPPVQPAEDMTQLLRAWKSGSREAFEQIVQAQHAEFLRMADGRLRGHGDLSLSRGDLVNEAMLRLMRSRTDWADRAHFFATVSLTMRSVLREHARARLADKRNAGQRVTLTLDRLGPAEEAMAAELLTLDALLERLAGLDPRAAQVLDLTYFSGLKREQIAEVLAVSLATVDRELRFARAWLRDALGRELEA